MPVSTRRGQLKGGASPLLGELDESTLPKRKKARRNNQQSDGEEKSGDTADCLSLIHI